MPTRDPVEILLIEDSEYDAELTFKAVKAKLPSVHYLHLRDGQQALDYLLGKEKTTAQQAPPLLILLDLDLPKVKGLSILEAIKTHDDTRRIPVVVWTISKDRTAMEQAYTLGANSYVIKPISFVKYSLAVADIVTYWLTVNDLPDFPKIDP